LLMLGMKLESIAPAIFTQGKAKADCVRVWFWDMKEKVTMSPTAALMVHGEKTKPLLPPTMTWWFIPVDLLGWFCWTHPLLPPIVQPMTLTLTMTVSSLPLDMPLGAWYDWPPIMLSPLIVAMAPAATQARRLSRRVMLFLFFDVFWVFDQGCI